MTEPGLKILSRIYKISGEQNDTNLLQKFHSFAFLANILTSCQSLLTHVETEIYITTI